MNFKENNKLSAILNRLFKPYEERVPVVDKIMTAMLAHGIIEEDQTSSMITLRSEPSAFRIWASAHLRRFFFITAMRRETIFILKVKNSMHGGIPHHLKSTREFSFLSFGLAI
jgi:hypothetical protein